MAKPRMYSYGDDSSTKKTCHTSLSLKAIMDKLQRSLSLARRSTSSSKDQFNEFKPGDSDCVPHDVKKGHFAVIAMGSQNEPTRLVIPLTCLNHPVFLSFLDKAAEEYGFGREGVLIIPCRLGELESILSGQ